MADTRKQLSTALNQFYHKPVAKVSLELFLSLGTVIFFAIFAIRPTLLTMADLIKEIEDKETLDQQLGQKVAALSTAQVEFFNLQSQLALLDEALPNQPDLIVALKIIEKIASDRQIIITNVTVSELPREEPLPDDLKSSQIKRASIPITLSVTGDYPTIRQFVEDLQNSRRTFVIDSVAFSSSEERGVKRLQATLNLSLPYFGTSAGAAAEGDGAAASK
jgi:Tfp pilus assembly protein PilO